MGGRSGHPDVAKGKDLVQQLHRSFLWREHLCLREYLDRLLGFKGQSLGPG